MSKNPFVNALLAIVYITVVASIMYYGPQISGPVDGIIAPVAVLSLLVLSASVMGYLFFYNPVRMYLDGSKEDAVKLFLKTIGVFACITVLIFIALFLLPIF